MKRNKNLLMLAAAVAVVFVYLAAMERRRVVPMPPAGETLVGDMGLIIDRRETEGSMILRITVEDRDAQNEVVERIQKLIGHRVRFTVARAE